MRKQFTFFLISTLALILIPTNFSNASNLANKLKGKILLQVEDSGQAWYIDPETEERAFLGRPADAFRIMRELGLGISENTYNSFSDYAPDRLSGKILLRVEASGEAYYVNPTDLKLYYLGRPADAFQVMREQGLGITNADLNNLPIYEKYSEQANKNTNTLNTLQQQLEEQAKLILGLQESQKDEAEAKNKNDVITHLSAIEVFEKVSPSVVLISNGGLGSGFIIDESGYILTNAHVVDNTDYGISITTKNGNQYIAELIGIDVNIDLALVKINKTNLPKLTIANSVIQGEDVYSLGYPEGFSVGVDEISIKDGIYSRRVTENSIEYLEHTAEIHHGNSGGPLVNDRGEVIGVNTRYQNTDKGTDPIKLSLPYDTVNLYYPLLQAGRNVTNYSTKSTSSDNNDYSVYIPDIEIYYDEGGHRYVVEFKDQSERDIRIKKMVISLPETGDHLAPYFNTSWNNNTIKNFDKGDDNEYVFVREETSIDPPDSIYIYGSSDMIIDLSDWIIWDYTDDKQVNL